MSDAVRSSSARSGTLSALGFALLAIGILFNPLLTAVAVGVLGMAVASRPGSRVAGYSVMALAAVLLLFQVGYGIGKDMAHRDNATQASANTGAA
ncbi:hypothetical protein ACFPN1_16115 [Lysobacter yangpyeongensis]|uniref:DUF4190 domain-containing protein n=1 Tax=Lysobacter yangpyeongensis TaxID=346182 RepID=A0ABW0SRX2_9GAMM